MGPLVSVIMSAYNHRNYVTETIESVLGQTFSNLEFLIADDHSTDGTDHLIRGFSDPRIMAYYQKVNTGGCSAFLRGKSIGKYIAIIHSDDVWLPDKLEKQVAYMEAHPECAACFTHAALIDEGSNTDVGFDMGIDIFRHPNRTQAEWLRYFFTTGNCLCHPSILARRDIYIELENNRALRQLPDFNKWISLVKNHPIHIIQADLTLHRRHLKTHGNMSFYQPENTIRNFEEAYCLSETYFDNMPDDLFIDAFSDIFRNPQACTPFELICEKYFLLLDHWQFGGYASALSAAVFFFKNCGNANVLKTLEDVYGYTLRDYYALTGRINIDWLNQFNLFSEYQGTIHFDTGLGFSEQEKVVFSFSQAKNCINWSGILPHGCKAVRFDPVELTYCAVKKIRVHAGTLELIPTPLNGITTGEYTVFDTLDPQYLINIPDAIQDELCISCVILVAPENEMEYISAIHTAFLHQLEQHKKYYLSAINELENQIEYIKTKLTYAENAFNEISNSTFWKATKPFRAILDCFKKGHRQIGHR